MIKFIKNLLKLKNRYNDKALENILYLCNTVRPDQEYCPDSIILEFKQLCRYGVDDNLRYAFNIADMNLTLSQRDNLLNKVTQSKEYKALKTRKRVEEMSKDFN